VLVIDDEPLALRVIKAHAARIPFLNVVYATSRVLDALLFLQTTAVDLIFLDVQMPELSGLEFMKIFPGKAKIILTTAYQQYALDSYDYEVTDYLLKPVSFERMLKAVQRAQNQIAAEKALHSAGIQTETGTSVSAAYIFIKTEYKLQKVLLEDILYLIGGKDYVTLVTRKEKILSLAGLTRIQQHLPHPEFLRVHKSYLVAVDKIDAIERQRIFIAGQVIPIGDTYKEEFANHIKGI
jgi:two-component system LytT family response regulator